VKSVSIPFISFQSREQDVKVEDVKAEKDGLNPFHLFSEQGTDKNIILAHRILEESQSLSSLFRAGNNLFLRVYEPPLCIYGILLI